MELCQVCKAWVAKHTIDGVPVCPRCLKALDSRLFKHPNHDVELALLERMWNPKGQQVKP